MKKENHQNEKSKSLPSRPVILDWNILQYWLDEKTSDHTVNVLLEAHEANLVLYTSAISIYEAQKQIPVGDEKQALNLIHQLPQFPLDEKVLLMSAELSCCYAEHHLTKSHAEEISLPDKMNAASAIVNGSLLMTSDFNDYPRPFFDEVWKWTIYRKTKKANQSIKIYLLRPDVEQVQSMVGSWQEKNEQVRKSEVYKQKKLS